MSDNQTDMIFSMERFQPAVSIVIPLYNALHDYEVCFRSLGTQTLKPYEVVVIDSASTDGAGNCIAAEFPWVKLIRQERNLGYRGGARLGAAHATGEFLVVVNQDVEFEPDFIETLVAPFSHCRNVGMVAPLILLYSDRKRVNEAGNAFHFSGLYGSRGLGRFATEFLGTTDLGMVSGCCFCMRLELWRTLGGFSENVDTVPSGWHAGNEDQDLSWRVRLAGYDIKLAAASRLYHKFTQKPWTGSRLASYYGCYLQCLLLMFRLRTLAVLSPFTVLNLGLLWLKAVRGGWATMKIVGKVQLDLIVRWREVIRMRKAVQRGRRVPDAMIVASMETELTVSQNRWAQGLYSAGSKLYYAFFRFCVAALRA